MPQILCFASAEGLIYRKNGNDDYPTNLMTQ